MVVHSFAAFLLIYVDSVSFVFTSPCPMLCDIFHVDLLRRLERERQLEVRRRLQKMMLLRHIQQKARSPQKSLAAGNVKATVNAVESNMSA